MWYRRRTVAQALNIPGPIYGLPGAPARPAPPPPPADEPELQLPPDQQPAETELPPGMEAPPPDDQVLPPPNIKLPPVHDRCHCRIETLPGGRQVWKANDSACPECLAARDAFNQWQSSIYDI